jgi:hypothetical protein
LLQWASAASAEDNQIRPSLIGRNKQTVAGLFFADDRLHAFSPRGRQFLTRFIEHGSCQVALQLACRTDCIVRRPYIDGRWGIVEQKFVFLRHEEADHKVQRGQAASRSVNSDERTHNRNPCYL